MKMYFEWKQKGLCVKCGKPDRLEGKLKCSKCYQHQIDSWNRRKKKATKIGKCAWCFNKDAIKNRKLCIDCSETSNKRNKAEYSKIRNICIKAYGGKCNCCQIAIEKYLELDHVNNDGAAHRKELRKDKTKGRIGLGDGMYRWAVKNNFPDKLQILCGNCHNAKTKGKPCTLEDHVMIEYTLRPQMTNLLHNPPNNLE